MTAAERNRDMQGILFNGKFFSGGRTGVFRVAQELVCGVDKLLGAQAPEARPRVELIHPPDSRDLPPLEAITPVRLGPLTWQVWEQFQLPTAVRGKLLVNLCNLAPLTVRPSVTMIHDAQVFLSPQSYSLPFRKWYQFALPRIGAQSLFVLTVSEYSKAQLVRFGVAPPEKIRVLPNGVDHLARVAPAPEIVGRLGLEPRRFVVALSSTQKHKNIARLFEVFSRSDFAHMKLVLVGSAGAQDFAAIGASPPANAVFAGRVSDAELRGLLEAAAAMALPSTTEGFGLPPVEAMYLGCPAVVSDGGAIPEACGAGAAYAHPDDTDAWANALLPLLEDPDAWAQASARGRDHAKDKTWARSSAQLLQWLVAAGE